MSIFEANQPVVENIVRIIELEMLKQYAVAEKAGLSARELSDMLNGRRVIKASEIPNIAKALGVTPNELYGIQAKSPKTA